MRIRSIEMSLRVFEDLSRVAWCSKSSRIAAHPTTASLRNKSRKAPYSSYASFRYPLRQEVVVRTVSEAHTAQRASFHSSKTLCKQKGGKQDAKKNIEKAKGKADAANNDPDDFSALESKIKEAHTLMKDELSKLRPGGQFNHQLLEALRVKLGKEANETAKLGDLATVVPKTGRQIMVMVGEQDHVKPVSSAIMSSQYNMNPSVNPHNPLELTLSVPPPTAESRKQVLETADKAGEKTLHTIRQARGAQQKKLNAMEKVRTVRPDDLKRSRDRMEKVVEEANKEAKEILKKARAALEK